MARDSGRKREIEARLGVWFAMCVILGLCAFGARGQSASTSVNVSGAVGLAQLDVGQVSKNTYHNPQLGFSYEFPRGWVVNDKATQKRTLEAGHQFVWSDDSPTKAKKKDDRQCTKDLLSVSRFPEEMRMGGVDSPLAYVVAADPKCAPGVSFPTTVKDHEAIQRIASQLGIYFKSLPVLSKSPAHIRAFENAGRVMLEISQSYTFYLHEPGNSRAPSIDSSVLAMQAHDYWVMWMFIGEGDTELDQMRASKIFFDAPPEPAK
jgi:hypothetical protein